VGDGFTLCSLVAQPVLATTLAALFNAAAPSGRANSISQEPAVNVQEPAASQVAGTPSPSSDVPQSQGPQPAWPARSKKPQKLRNWTGSLVDAGCMSNALRRDPSIDEALFPDPLSDFWQTLESSKRAEQERNVRERSPQGQPQTPSRTAWTGDSDGKPEASERQIAIQKVQLKRAKMLRQKAGACTPTKLTMHYGLVDSGGQLLRFDTAGNLKAKEATYVSTVEPGKTVKAKVTGVVEAEGTVWVTSVEIKGQTPSPRTSSSR